MALYIFSDAHLGAGPPDLESKKIRMLAKLFQLVRNDGDQLVILGDLFDFWFEYKHAIPKGNHEALFLLRDLVKAGVQVDYVSGNHDFWMGDYFERQLGVHLHRDSLNMSYPPKETCAEANTFRLHLIHGDGLAKADSGYRLLKRILRNRTCISAYRLLPADWAIPLAKWVSGSSRAHTSKRDSQFAEDYKQYAQGKLSEGFDIVAIAHLHIPVELKIGDGYYVNTGDFINHFCYLKIDGSSVKLLWLNED